MSRNSLNDAMAATSQAVVRRLPTSCGIFQHGARFRTGVTHGGRKGLILVDQVRAVDKTRLAKKLGVVSAKTLKATLGTLQEIFAE